MTNNTKYIHFNTHTHLRMTTTLKRFRPFLLLFAAVLGTLSSQAQLLINEMSAANLTHLTDAFDKHEDWVEIYNPTSAAVSLQGWFLSDRKNNPTKFLIDGDVSVPAGGFIVAYCSGRGKILDGVIHTSFRISQTRNTAEEMTLSNPQGLIVDSKKVKTVHRDHAYGRKTDGDGDWGVTTQPSPGASNNPSKYYEDYAKHPVMDSIAGFYSGPITVKMSILDTTAVIRYTTTGDEPTAASPKYTNPVNLTTTKVLKAKSFPTDTTLLPSIVEFNTYFINENLTFTMPVFSISGTQLLALANGAQELRPYGALEVFGTDKSRVARVTGELNSHGQDSWVNDQRSLDWISRDEMGINAAINEALFPKFTERDEFQRMMFRAAGDDNYPGGSNWPGQNAQPLAAHMRDAYTQNLAKRDGLHLDTRTGEKAILFLNGRYWGVYDIREAPDDHDYTEFNYNQGKFDLDYLASWGGTWAEYASTSEEEVKAEWNNLVDYIMTNDMSDQAKFEVVKEQLDHKSLVDYMLVNSFANASDWLNYNTSWWRGMNPEGGHRKWGYILWDLDATYAYYINYTGILDTSATAPPCNVELIDLSDWAQWDPYPQQHLDILKKLQDNAEFRQYWITRQADLSKSTFGCDNMLSYFDEVLASIDGEMPRHIQKWGGSYTQWRGNVARLRNFIERRCAYFSTGLPECYNVSGPFNTVLMVDPPLSGSIQANTLTYKNFPIETPFFGDIDLLLNAIPAGNNTFDHWEIKKHSVADSSLANISIFMTEADTIIAHFKGTAVDVQQPVVPQPDVLVFPTVVKNGFSVDFTLPEKARVSIRLVDVAGKTAQEIMQPGLSEISGNQRIFVHTKDLAAGTYFLQFTTDKGYSETTKMVVMKP